MQEAQFSVKGAARSASRSEAELGAEEAGRERQRELTVSSCDFSASTRSMQKSYKLTDNTQTRLPARTPPNDLLIRPSRSHALSNNLCDIIAARLTVGS
jgi:hypothetical protein